MNANRAMRRLLAQVGRPLRDLPDLDDQEQLVEAGWTRTRDGNVLLAALVTVGGQPSGYEVNDVAVRPVLQGPVFGEERAVASLETGLSFARRAVLAARELPEFAGMVTMVSVAVDFDDEDFNQQPATLRFFGEAHRPISLEDLDKFELEAIGLWSFPEVLAWDDAGDG